jgi:hypothetical protein
MIIVHAIRACSICCFKRTPNLQHFDLLLGQA